MFARATPICFSWISEKHFRAWFHFKEFRFDRSLDSLDIEIGLRCMPLRLGLRERRFFGPSLQLLSVLEFRL